jgi:lipoate synthase
VGVARDDAQLLGAKFFAEIKAQVRQLERDR